MELDQIETPSKPLKKKNYSLGIILLISLAGLVYYFSDDLLNSIKPKPPMDTNFGPYVDFAENFVIAFNNISYVNQARKGPPWRI